MQAKTPFAHLSDRELTSEIVRLAERERNSVVDLVTCIEEFDRRQLFLPAGFSSMFIYCTHALHLGEGAAYRRIQTARAARRFPCILDYIGDGRVTLTTVTLLASHMTEQNHIALLDEVVHKTKDQVKLIVARLKPLPDAATIVRKLPGPRRVEQTQVPGGLSFGAAESPEAPVTPHVSAGAPPSHPPVVAPLTPERFKIQVTVSREAHDNLRELQALLRHSIPSGDAALIVERALKVLLEDVQRKKFGLLRSPKKAG